MMKLKRIDIAFGIAMVTFELSLFVTLALFYFTTAIVVSTIILGVAWYYAFEWLNYCFPKKQKMGQAPKLRSTHYSN